MRRKAHRASRAAMKRGVRHAAGAAITTRETTTCPMARPAARRDAPGAGDRTALAEMKHK